MEGEREGRGKYRYGERKRGASQSEIWREKARGGAERQRK